jgi:hypothetical protein
MQPTILMCRRAPKALPGRAHARPTGRPALAEYGGAQICSSPTRNGTPRGREGGSAPGNRTLPAGQQRSARWSDAAKRFADSTVVTCAGGAPSS